MNAALFNKLMAIREKRILPTDGLVFYMPMKDTITKAIVNGAEVKSAAYFAGASDVSYTIDNTIPCTCFNGNTWLYHLPVTATEYTMTLWFKPQIKTLSDGGDATSHYVVSLSGVDYAMVNTTGSTTIRWGGKGWYCLSYPLGGLHWLCEQRHQMAFSCI